jgi:hypothetical protein
VRGKTDQKENDAEVVSDVARKTVIVSDLTGKEIEAKDAAR